MAKDSVVAKIGRALRGIFSGKKRPPVRREITGGHRGIAAGDLAERQRRQAAGQEPFSLEEIEKWENLSGDEATDFVYAGIPVPVNSSNVNNVTYFIEEKKMLVVFNNGGRYMYSSISEQEAQSFIQAQSKGAWVWDNLRVRGSRTAHRKPFTKL